MDHLVSGGEQRFGDVEAQRLGGFEVDHRFVLSRRLHRQVGWLFAFKDAVDVAGCEPILVDHIGPIGDQAAAGNEKAVRIDRGQAVASRKRDDQFARPKVLKKIAIVSVD